MSTYTGDLLLSLNDNLDWDINYINGQPDMTDGLDTAVMLSIFTEPDTWQNGMTNNPSEKYISEFPSIIAQGKVNDDTLKAGIEALRRCLKWLKDDSIAADIQVTGGALSVYGLYWQIDIIRGNIDNKYQVNWDKGVTQLTKVQGAE